MTNKIPKIIHQIWFGDVKKRPSEMMKTWQEKNPTWEYKIWTENNIFELKNKKQYELATEYSGKADIARYEILYNHGGFYIDADSVCLKPLEDWLLDNDSFACYESETVVPGLIANGYLASCQHNVLMKLLMDEISKVTSFTPAWMTTGPLLLTNSVRKYSYNSLKIYPSHYFIPKHCRGTTRYSGSDHVFAEQYWGSSFNLYGTLK